MTNREDILLEAVIDKRINHNSNNLQMTIQLMHESQVELDKRTALMSKDMEYTKKTVEGIDTKLDSFISSAHTRFATKTEHSLNSKRIDGLAKILLTIWVWMIMGIIYALMDLITK